MKNNKEDNDIENTKKEFIKEQIKSDKKKAAFGILKKIGLTLVLALFFGAVSSTTIYVMNHFLKVKLPFSEGVVQDNDDEVRVIKTAEPDDKTVSEIIDDGDKEVLADFKEASIKYAKVGKMCNDFMVSVVLSKSKSDWFNESIKRNEEKVGIIFESDDDYYYIFTPDFVEDNDSDISIRFKDSKEYKTEVLAKDEMNNFAVLSLKKSDLSKEDLDDIKVAELSDSALIETGTPIVAIGKPDGIMYSVIIGMVVNDTLSVSVTDNKYDIYMTDIKGSDNASGVIVDENGAVVGIISDDYKETTGNDYIAAISIADLKSDIMRMAAGEKRLYAGVSGADISENTNENLNVDSGVYVTGVEAGSPALQGGLRVSDIIVSIDKEDDITMKKLHEILSTHKEGDTLKIKILRGGKNKKNIKITIS